MHLLDVMFTQSDDEFDECDGFRPHDRLYNVEGVVMHGASLESIAEVTEFLGQWDSDMLDPSRTHDAPEPADDVWVVRVPEARGYQNTYEPTGGYSDWQVLDYVSLDQTKPGDYVLAGVRRAFASIALYRVVGDD